MQTRILLAAIELQVVQKFINLGNSLVHRNVQKSANEVNYINRCKSITTASVLSQMDYSGSVGAVIVQGTTSLIDKAPNGNSSPRTTDDKSP